MLSTKEIDAKKFPLVKKVSIPETLQLIPHGETARYRPCDIPPSSMFSAVRRLNQKAGAEEFSLEFDRNTGDYLVRRK